MGKHGGPRHPPYGPSHFPAKGPCESAAVTVSLVRLALVVMGAMARKNPVNDSCSAPSPNR